MNYGARGHVTVRGSKGSQLVLVNYLSNPLKEIFYLERLLLLSPTPTPDSL